MSAITSLWRTATESQSKGAAGGSSFSLQENLLRSGIGGHLFPVVAAAVASGKQQRLFIYNAP